MNEESKQSKGGAMRAKKLAPERRSEIARTASLQRWAKERVARDAKDELQDSGELPVAKWRGFLTIGDLDIPVYVLQTGDRVIGRTSATEMLTGIKGGGGLEKYLGVKSLNSFINMDLVLERLIPFRLPDMGRYGQRYLASLYGQNESEPLPKIEMVLACKHDDTLPIPQHAPQQKSDNLREFYLTTVPTHANLSRAMILMLAEIQTSPVPAVLPARHEIIAPGDGRLPRTMSKPQGKSAPLLPRNPERKSAPIQYRTPRCQSGPRKESNP